MTPAALAGRLDRGWMLCEREPDPRRRRQLEDHWLNLLQEYERLCDETAPVTGHILGGQARTGPNNAPSSWRQEGFPS